MAILVLFTCNFPAFSLDGQIHFNRFNLSFSVPTAVDLDRGYVDAHYNASDLTVQVNMTSTSPWILYILSERPLFSPENLNKPLSDLLWKLGSESESQFRPVGLEKNRIAAGLSSLNTDLDFRLKLSWSDLPAEYGLEILFILESTP